MNNAFAFNQQLPFGNGNFDPSSAQFPPSFSPNSPIKSAGIDPAQFANPQLLQQRLNDGGARTQSPGFPPGSYQTNPLIPAKRARPGEDNVATGSPRPPPGGIPGASRGQMSGQSAAMAGFANNPFQPQNHFSHLQQPGSAQPSPSPVMQNQFRPPNSSQPQRMQNASPHPFGGMGSMTPGTPQSMNGTNMSATPQPVQGFHAPTPFGPSQSPVGKMPSHPNLASQQIEQQRLLQQRMQQHHQQQQHLQNQAASLQNRPGMPGKGASQSPQKPPAPNIPGQPPANPGLAAAQQKQQFIQSYTNWCKQRGVELNPRPQVCGRLIDYYVLFFLVTNFGILNNGPNKDNWGLVAEKLQIFPAQNPTAPTELKNIFDQNRLGDFILQYMSIIQKRKAQMQALQQQQQQQDQKPQMPTMPTMPTMPGPAQGSPLQQPSGTPVQQLPPQPQPLSSSQRPSAEPQQPGSQQQTPSQATKSLPSTNGTLHGPVTPTFRADALKNAAGSASTPQRGTHPLQKPTPTPARTQSNSDPWNYVQPLAPDPIYEPTKFRDRHTWGGLELRAASETGDRIQFIREEASILEIGGINLHDLTRSLECGIHEEVRYALNQLVVLTSDHPIVYSRHYRRIFLHRCEDLLDSILECAETELNFLVEDTQEVTEGYQLQRFEDLCRSCRSDIDSLQDVHCFADDHHESLKHVENLSAVILIFRNMAETEARERIPQNRTILASPPVARFLCSLVRKLGTTKMLLKTNRNTLELVKDLVNLLAAIAAEIELASEEEALAMLQFLTSFAPKPTFDPKSKAITFIHSDGPINYFLTCAIEALAKILARDDPNRTLFKQALITDPTVTDPDQLLTEALALAISALPDFSRGYFSASRLRPTHRPGLDGLQPSDAQIVSQRRPYIALGMLAGDILASLAPGPESPLARRWLESSDGWAEGLFRMAVILSDHERVIHTAQGNIRDEDNGWGLITQRALSMLQKLVERVDFSSAALQRDAKSLAEILPIDNMLFGLVRSVDFDPESLRRILNLVKGSR